MKKIFFLVGFFIAFAQIAFAAVIFTSNSSGTQKTSFNTSEPVYLASSSNVTTNSTTVRAYIVYDSSTWTNGTSLTDVRGGIYTTFTTNDTGFLNNTLTNPFWSPTTVAGNYDVVLDADSDGVYSTNSDFVFQYFQIVPIPGPTLTISVGGNSTSNITYQIPSNNSDVVILQLKVTSGSNENVYLNSLSLIASGTGDAVKGISIVKLIQDNGNGVYDQGESILAGGKYSDNRLVTLTIPSGFVVPANTTSYFLIVYTMSNSSFNGNTYSFTVAGATGSGQSTGQSAKISGLTINAGILTVSSSLTASTTTTSSSSVTSSSPPTTSTATASTTTPENTNYFWIYIAGGFSIVVIIVFIIFYLSSSGSYQYEYKPPTQKE